MGRIIRGTGERVLALVFGPDRWSHQIAGLGVATNTFSPMSAGNHRGVEGATPRGFSSLDGYGVSRWAGETPYPLQHFAGAGAAPSPAAKRLGAGAGVSGQPGLPGTGEGSPDMAWLGHSPLARGGLRG